MVNIRIAVRRFLMGVKMISTDSTKPKQQLRRVGLITLWMLRMLLDENVMCTKLQYDREGA